MIVCPHLALRLCTLYTNVYDIDIMCTSTYHLCMYYSVNYSIS